MYSERNTTVHVLVHENCSNSTFNSYMFYFQTLEKYPTACSGRLTLNGNPPLHEKYM